MLNKSFQKRIDRAALEYSKRYAKYLKEERKAHAKDPQDYHLSTIARYERGIKNAQKQCLSIPYRPRLGLFKNSTGKAVFNPATFVGTSYGHWNVVQKIKGKVVFNNYYYSVTTSSHQSELRGLLRDLGIKIHATVEVAGGLQRFESEVLPPLFKKQFEAELRLVNPRTPKRLFKEIKQSIQAIQKQIKLCRSLGAKMDRKAVKALKDGMCTREKNRLILIKETAAQKRALAKNIASDALPAAELFA